MSISKILYGVNNPSITRITLIYTFLALVGLMVWGAFATFLPSDNWVKIGSRISFIVSAVVILLFWRAIFKDKLTTRIDIGFSKKLAFSIVGAPLIWLLFQGSLVYGAPAIFTQVFGNAGEIRGEFKKTYRNSRRSCDYRLTGSEIERAFIPYICISREEFDSLPLRVDIGLKGYKTYFGFIVNSKYEVYATSNLADSGKQWP